MTKLKLWYDRKMLKRNLLGFLDFLNSTRGFWTILGILWLLLFLKGALTLDPDFGWHIQMGNLIRKSGIPRTDPFSYTMPNYPYIDASWLSDVLISFLYPLIGLAGLAAIFATLVAGVFIVVVPNSTRKWAVIPGFLAASIFLARAGIRPQVIDWLFFAGLLRLISEKPVWIKWRWLSVPIFILWTNLHAGVVLGLGVYLLKTADDWLKSKRIPFTDLFLLILASLATLINPYGPRIWIEIINTLNSGFLRQTIAEWQPIWMRMEWGVIGVIGLMTAFIWWQRQKIPLWQTILSMVLIGASIMSLRHAALLAVIGMQLLPFNLMQFEIALPKNPTNRKRFANFKRLMILIAGGLFVLDLTLITKELKDLQSNTFCPIEAINYLRANIKEGEVFNYYGFGGCMIWKLPEKKTFVDGRMPVWQQPPRFGQSEWAYKEYIGLASGIINYADIFPKYDIKMVLWNKDTSNTGILTIWANNLFNSRLPKNAPQTLLTKLANDTAWDLIYKDKTALIYIKRK